ncbi:MAG TPA: MFS transporter [Bacteroidales bacterium]|nr:MFS transporter [Bacteroidales bacterium]
MAIERQSDAYAVWKISNFRAFITGRFFLTFAIQMQSVIIGWQVYALTHDPFSLGLIGLAEAIPFISMALLAGHVADRRNRRIIIILTASAYVICAGILLAMSFRINELYSLYGIFPIYLIIAVTGLARAFFYPAQSAYMANIVPRELYHNSSTWNSTVWHIAAVSGPAAGGLIYGFAGIHAAFITVVVFSLTGVICFLLTKSVSSPVSCGEDGILKSLKGGIRFVFGNQVLLGALSLDMFGVLFGGAVALLPVFAADVLHVGPQGLGLLRAAPAFGAVAMALYLAYHPPLSRSGKKLLLAVAGFGICIVLFAVSVNFYLSLILLVLSGAVDNVSVIIRGTILQLVTPDEMRGRVASVNSIFIGSSNELGSFESGLAAKLMGLVPSVVFGGGMTLLIAGLTARLAPKLRTFELRQF